jgi:hypothetical protein
MNKWKYYVVDLSEKKIDGPFQQKQARKFAKTARRARVSDLGLEIGTNIIVLSEQQIIDRLQGRYPHETEAEEVQNGSERTEMCAASCLAGDMPQL